MTIYPLKDLQTPIGNVLKVLGTDGVLLESNGNPEFALMPLDDDLLIF